MEGFTWVSLRIATSLEQLTPADITQWKAFLNDDGLDLGDWSDFFDLRNQGYDGYNEEIYIESWIWKSPEGPIMLKDMYAWPGDNQMGAIFIGTDSQPVFGNGDCDLVAARIENPTVLQQSLQSQLENLMHIRPETTMDHACKDHQYCQKLARCRQSALSILPEAHHELDRFVKESTKHFEDESHNHEHANAVYRNCLRIIECYDEALPNNDHDRCSGIWVPIENDVLTYASKLHDVRDHKYLNSISEDDLNRFLDIEIGEDKRKRVINIINNVSWSKQAAGKVATLPEPDQTYLTILRDADRIEALGKVGIDRCVQCTEMMGGRYPEDVVQHCYDKLLRLYNDGFITTRVGRQIAQPGHRYIESWVEETVACMIHGNSRCQ